MKRTAGIPRVTTRMGWHEYYASRPGADAAHLACWYLLLFLAFGER